MTVEYTSVKEKTNIYLGYTFVKEKAEDAPSTYICKGKN